MKVIIYFLLFLTYVSCLKIGYLEPKDESKEFYYILEAYINKISPTDPTDTIKVIDVVKSESSHGGSNVTLSRIFDKFMDANVTLVLTYCDDVIYNYDFSVNHSDIVVWCLNPVPPRLCSVNIIPGDMIGYSMETVVSIMVYNFYPNFVFIGGKDNTANAMIFEQYTLLSKSVGMNIAAYTITDVNETEIKRVADVAFDYEGGEGCYIMSTIDNEEQLDILGDHIIGRLNDDAKISLGFLYMLNDKLVTHLRNRYTSNFGIYSAYIKIFANTSTEEDKTDYTDLVSPSNGFPESDIQMVNKVIGIVKILLKAYERIPTNQANTLLSSVYDEPIDFPGGQMMLRSNHYTSTTYYVAYFGDNWLEKSIRKVDMDELNDPFNIFGEANPNKCDVLANYQTGIVENDMVNILFVNELSDDTIYVDRTVRLSMIQAVRSINKEGGVLDKSITPLYLSLSQINGMDELKTTLTTTINTYSVSAVFLICNTTTRNNIVQWTKNLDTQIFFMGYAEGNMCENNIVFTGPLGPNIVYEAVRFASEEGLENVFIIGDTGRGGSIGDLLKQELSTYGINTLAKFNIIQERNKTEECIRIADQLLSLKNNGSIFITAESVYNKDLFSVFYDKGITNENNWIVVSFTLDELQAEKIHIDTNTNFTGYYSIGHYFSYINHTLMYDVQVYLKDLLGVDVVVSNEFVNTYDTLRYWMSAVQLASSTSVDLYRTHLYENYLNKDISPGGIYTVEYDGYVCNVLRLVMFENSTATLKKTNTFVHTTNIFHNKTLQCTFKEDPLNGVHVTNVYYVGVLYDIRTYEGIQLSDNIQLVVDLINLNGGVNGKRLDVLIDSEYDGNLTASIERMMQNKSSSILTFIGTTLPSERDQIEEILEEKDKLLISPSQSVGEVAYKNILQFNAIVNQFAEYPVLQFYQSHGCVYGIFDDSALANATKHFITMRLGNFSYTPHMFSYNDSFLSTEDGLKQVTQDFNDTLITVDRCATFTVLGKYTAPVFDYMFNNLVDHFDNINFPMIMLDYPKDDIKNYAKKNNMPYDSLVGCYGVALYSTQINTTLNAILMDQISTYKGEPAELISSITAAAYNGLRTFQMYMSDDIKTSTEFRNKLYNNDLDTASGTYRLYSSNYASTTLYIMEILDKDLSVRVYSDFIYPVYPRVWNTFDHNDKYYETNFIDDRKMIETEVVGVAFILDITNFNTSNTIYRYFTGIINIEKNNIDGLTHFKRIEHEIYDCPKDSGEASGLLVKLQKRGFNLIIGGCDTATKTYLTDGLEFLNMLMIYTGINDGGDCSSNIIYASASPAQRILAPLIYFLLKIQDKFALITDSDYQHSRRLIVDVLNTTNYEIVSDEVIDLEGNVNSQILEYLTHLTKKYKEGISILLIGKKTTSEILLKTLYTVLKESYDNNVTKIFEKFPVYIYDSERAKYDDPTYTTGAYVFSTLFYSENQPLNVDFFTKYSLYAPLSEDPNYYDALFQSTVTLLAKVLKKTNTMTIDEIRSLFYTTSVETLLGTLEVGSDNYISQGNWFGKVEDDGVIRAIERINEKWNGETWRESLNQYPYYLCDFQHEGMGSKVEPLTLPIGIIISANPAYYRDSLLLIESTITMVEYIRLQIDEKEITTADYLSPFYISLPDNTTRAMEIINEYKEKYNIQAFFGGWSTELRRTMNKQMKLDDKLLFYFYEYEGDECLSNTIYLSNPYSSYFMITPWLVEYYTGTSFVLVYSITTTSEAMAQKLKEELDFYRFNVVLMYGCPNENTDLSPLATLVKRIAPNGAMFLSFLMGKSAKLLLDALAANDMSPPTYTSLSIDIDYLMVDKKSIGHFYLISVDSTQIHSTVADDFGSVYTRYISYQPVLVQKFSRPASSIYIFYHAYMNSGRDAKASVLRNNLMTETFDTPQGLISFLPNNLAKDYIRIRKVVEDKTSPKGFATTNIYDSGITISPKPYEDFYADKLYMECNMSDENALNGTVIPKVEIIMLFSSTGSRSSVDVKAIDGAMTALRKISDDGFVEGYSFQPILIDYQSDDSKIRELLHEPLARERVVGLIGCTTLTCKEIAQEEAKEHNKVFIYPKQSLGQECNFNTIYTGPVPNQYVSRLLQFILTLDINQFVYFVGNSDSESKLFFSIFTDASSGLLVHQSKSDIFINDTYALSTQKLKQYLFNDENNVNGGVIMVYLRSDEAIQFLELCQTMKIDKAKWGIFIMGLETEELVEAPDDELDGIYIPSHYFPDVESEVNTEMKKYAYHYSSAENPSALFLSCYVGISFIAQGLKKNINDDWEYFRYNLYNEKLDAGAGTITLETNHHVTLPFFVAKYSKTTSSFKTVYSKFDHASPDAWSWYIPEYSGKRCSYDDLTNKGEKYDVNVLRVLLIATITGSGSDESSGIVDSYQLVIDEVNTLGGIQGYVLKGDIYDTQSIPAQCTDYAKQYIETNKPLFIVVSISVECLKEIITAANDNDVIVLMVSQIDINYCETNLIVGSFHPTFYENILNVMIDRYYDNYLLIGAESFYVTSFVQTFFDKYHYTLYDPFTYTSLDENLLTKYLQNLTNVSPSTEKNIIIFMDSIDNFGVLKKTLDSLKLTEPYVNVLSLEYYFELKDKGYKSFEGVTGYNYLIDSEMNNNFRAGIQQRLGMGEPISDYIERSYSALRLAFVALNESAELTFASIRESILKVSFDSPEGVLTFANNQFLTRNVVIFKVDENGKESLVYEQARNDVPVAYYFSDTTMKLCDFSESTIGSSYSPTTYPIALIFSVTGEWKENEIPIMQAVILGLTEINDDDYFSGTKVVYYFYDAKSSTDGYKEALNKALTDNKNIHYIFGGYNHDTYNALSPIVESKELIWFFTGTNFDIKCYNHTYAFGKHTSQIAEVALRYTIEYTTNVVFIHKSSDEYSNDVYKWTYSRFSNVSMSIIGNIDYTDASTTVRTIKTVLRSGGYILNFLTNDSIDLFDEMSQEGLKAPTYVVISVLLDENILNKVKSPNDMVGHILLDSYFESLSHDKTSDVGVISLAADFNDALHSKIGPNLFINSELEAAYDAVKIWGNVVSKLSSADQYDVSLFKNVYTLVNSVPAGTIEVNSNNIVARRMFAAEIQSDLTLLVKYGPENLIQPTVYNQYSNDTGWFCDTQRSDMKYYSNPIYIAFIHQKDVGIRTEIYMSFIEDVAVSEINENGGLLNRKLIGVHFFPAKDLIFGKSREIVQSNQYEIVIGCMTPYCRDEVSRYVNRNDNDMLFIHTGRDDGNKCYRCATIVGTTISQKLPIILNYLKDIGLSSVIIIGLNDDYAKIEAEAIRTETIKAGYKVELSSFFSPYSTADISQLLLNVTDIISRIGRVAVMNIFESNENQILFKSLIDLGVDFSQFNPILFHYEPFEYTDDVLEQLSGAFVVSSYSTVLSDTTSQSFKFAITQRFSKYQQMSESIESAYSAINLWKQSVEYSVEQTSASFPSRAYVRLSYFNIRYDAPSGSVQFKHNNHLSKSVSVFKIQNGDIELVTPRQGVKEVPDTILYDIDEDTECTFDKDVSNYSYNEVIRIVIIVFAVLNYLFVVVVAALVGLYRNTKVILSASPVFLFYSLFAILLIATEGLFFIFQPNSSWVCVVRVWGLALSVLLLFSIIFSKAWRIHKLFNNKKLARVKIANKQLLQMIAMMMAVELVYLIIWWVVDQSVHTLRLSVTYSNYLEDIYLVECTQNNYFVIIQVVLLFLLFCYGGKLAWSVRNAASDFNESMSLAMTIALLCIMGIIEVPLNYLMEDDPSVLLVFRGLGIELGTFFIIIIQFGSKVTYLWVHEITTTTGSSLSGPTGSGSGTSSANLKIQRQNLRNNASNGKYPLEPDILICSDLTLCSLSNPELFYIESADKVARSTSSRNSTNKLSTSNKV